MGLEIALTWLSLGGRKVTLPKLLSHHSRNRTTASAGRAIAERFYPAKIDLAGAVRSTIKGLERVLDRLDQPFVSGCDPLSDVAQSDQSAGFGRLRRWTIVRRARPTPKTHRMPGFYHNAADAFWHVIDLPIRWINGGPIDPDIERLQEGLELAILLIVASIGVLIAWDLISRSLRRREQRQFQNQRQRRT
jgi:hypothetical protein